MIVPSVYSIAPPQGAWVSNNSYPYTRRATALGLLTTCTNFGTILATWLLAGTLSPAPEYRSAGITFLAFQAGGALCAAVNWVWLKWRNESRRRERAMVVAADVNVDIGGVVKGEMRVEREEKGKGDDSVQFVYKL